MLSTRLAVSVHILVLMHLDESRTGPTSVQIGEVIETHPVAIRRLTVQLARAGLIRVARGAGGGKLRLLPAEISLEDVWLAVEPNGSPLLPIHDSLEDSAEENLKTALVSALSHVENDARAAMAQITLQHILDARRSALPVTRPLHSSGRKAATPAGREGGKIIPLGPRSSRES
jgi:DNA-binding IscR family transcriptional regulator